MDGREFWNRVYRILDETGMTITDLSKQLGLSRGAIYNQINSHIYPKIEQLRKMQDLFGFRLLDEPSKWNEYLPYLDKAEEWQIKSIRQILGMPELKKEPLDSTTMIS